MTKDWLKIILPYAGIPIIGVALLLIRSEQISEFKLLLYEMLAAFGYVAAITDIKEKRIPNGLILTMLGAWVIVMIPKLFIDIGAAEVLLKEAALGFISGGGLFLLVYIISRQGLGGGDVKFMATAGVYAGFAGIISAMLYGTILAALVCLFLLLFKKIGRKDAIPLAPFLYIGILITIFYG